MTTDPIRGGDTPRADTQAPPSTQAPQAPQFGHAQPGHPQAQPGYPQAQPGYPQAPQEQFHYGQQPPGHSQPQSGFGPAPGAQAPAASAPKNEYFDFTDYQFRMPTTWPKSIGSATPSFRGGIGNVFQTAHMPMDARIGYWVWLVGCVLSIIGWFFSMGVIVFGILFNPFILVATGMVGIFGGIRWGVILLFAATMLFALVMMLVQLFLTLKIREGAEWARLGLTALTLVSIVYSIILTAAGLESGGAGTVTVNIVSLLLIAFFWLPKANDWFLRTTDGDTPPAGPRRSARH